MSNYEKAQCGEATALGRGEINSAGYAQLGMQNAAYRGISLDHRYQALQLALGFCNASMGQSAADVVSTAAVFETYLSGGN